MDEGVWGGLTTTNSFVRKAGGPSLYAWCHTPTLLKPQCSRKLGLARSKGVAMGMALAGL